MAAHWPVPCAGLKNKPPPGCSELIRAASREGSRILGARMMPCVPGDGRPKGAIVLCNIADFASTLRSNNCHKFKLKERKAHRSAAAPKSGGWKTWRFGIDVPPQAPH